MHKRASRYQQMRAARAAGVYGGMFTRKNWRGKRRHRKGKRRRRSTVHIVAPPSAFVPDFAKPLPALGEKSRDIVSQLNQQRDNQTAEHYSRGRQVWTRKRCKQCGCVYIGERSYTGLSLCLKCGQDIHSRMRRR
jgi:hypothetical protein